MNFVVDCSVVVRWFLPDEATPCTDAAFELLDSQVAVVPALLLSQSANVFIKLARQRKLKHGLAQGVVMRFGKLGLAVDRLTPEPDRLFALADQYGLSAYDATYLELALRLGLPLACWDGGLKGAAVKGGLYLDLP